ncbi:MAG TPA: hypothetical protein VFI28_02730 [Candidatus Limnocylindrales bacterium]|nr:hypothetical protein [Candidatus Limnocylindrales bacterium]
MRLSDWRATAPHRDALGPRVLAIVEPVLAAFGAEPDPHVWIAWGDDPGVRYSLFALAPAGVAVCAVRPTMTGEGPRMSGKLVRWGRVQLGELSIESQAGHRLLSAQLEGQVLKGVDLEADRIARFIVAVAAGIDGRPIPSPDEPRARRRVQASTTGRAGRTKSSAPAASGGATGSRSMVTTGR